MWWVSRPIRPVRRRTRRCSSGRSTRRRARPVRRPTRPCRSIWSSSRWARPCHFGWSARLDYGLAHVNGDQGQAELRSLIYSVLAGMKPREREVVKLSFRHDLHDNDLAIVLGVSSTRAQALAARAHSRLEEALGVLHIALTGRAACPVLGELLADWDGQLTEEARDLVSGHIEECQTCAHHGWGALRPAAFSRLLPLAPLPLELREQVLGSCTSTAEDAVMYRRRVVRRADSRWAATFSRAIKWVSWDGIRSHPGAAVATTAVALWVVAAVSLTLLTFAGPRAAHAQAARPTGSPVTHAQAAETNATISPRRTQPCLPRMLHRQVPPAWPKCRGHPDLIRARGLVAARRTGLARRPRPPLARSNRRVRSAQPGRRGCSGAGSLTASVLTAPLAETVWLDADGVSAGGTAWISLTRSCSSAPASGFSPSRSASHPAPTASAARISLRSVPFAPMSCSRVSFSLRSVSQVSLASPRPGSWT